MDLIISIVFSVTTFGVFWPAQPINNINRTTLIIVLLHTYRGEHNTQTLLGNALDSVVGRHTSPEILSLALLLSFISYRQTTVIG